MESKLLIDEPAFVASGRAQPPREDVAGTRSPLIVAIHGGGFTAGYFDIEGYSLLDRAASRGFGVLGLDRLGYGDSRADGMDTQTLANNQEWISRAIDRLWPQYADSCAGIVLVGHSIGAALALMVAATPQNWPLLGIAVSGAALEQNPVLSGYFGNLPTDPWIESPAEDKDRLMLGQPGTFSPDVPALLHPAYRSVSTQELIEIYSVWGAGAADFLKAITVPVHYRMGEQDFLWIVNEAMVDTLSTLLSGVDGSSVAIVEGAGHAIDFHNVGEQFQNAQLDFALKCTNR